MDMKYDLKQLIEELDTVHEDGFFSRNQLGEHEVFLNFNTARNGFQRHFSKAALKAISSLTRQLHESDVAISSVIEVKGLETHVRQCIANLHAEEVIDPTQMDGPDGAYEKFLKEVHESLSQLHTVFTHFFPAWTLGMEHDRPFVIGPVTVMTRDQWLDSVEFPEHLLQYGGESEKNAVWKQSVKGALQNRNGEVDLVGLAETVYSVLKNCPAILKVTVTGYEVNLSRKVGEIVCKSALDSISLLFGGQNFFHQQALAGERMVPISSSSMLEMNGKIWLPGRTMGPRIKNLEYPTVRDHLVKNSDVLNAIGKILDALLNPAHHTHPNLAKRWTTALDWMAEGSRDKNDAVALTKMATSLDVLSCGGKCTGILGMLSHLFNLDKEKIVVTSPKERKLKDLVSEVYGYGRSQILHGTHFDRLKSFEATKNFAAQLASGALVECAVRLQKFNGADGDKAFRTIPA